MNADWDHCKQTFTRRCLQVSQARWACLVSMPSGQRELQFNWYLNSNQLHEMYKRRVQPGDEQEFDVARC
jgi:hypothetical protein